MDWEEVVSFLEEIGRPRGGEPLILTAFPPEPGKPNIHLPGDLGEAHRREVERTLRKHPRHSLGLVINPARAQPEDWGSRPDERRADGSPRVWGARNDHIRGAVAVWAECDGGLPLEEQCQLPDRAGLPSPSLTVWSGGKSLHFYWLLARGEALLEPERWRSLTNRLTGAIDRAAPEAGVDQGLSNPGRVMRLPGGLHPKTGERCVVQSVGMRRYTAQELEALIPALPSSTSSSSLSSSSAASGAPAGEGAGWFDRLPPDQQHKAAVEMVRHLPLRTEAGKGMYGDSLKALAALVHQFGADEAGAICEEAGWTSAEWNPVSKAHTIGATSRAAGMGTVISEARKHGWQHPLQREEAPQASSSSPLSRAPSFAEKWAQTEAEADRLVREGGPTLRLVLELTDTAPLSITRSDASGLLEAAQRRLRPASEPLQPGAVFRVNPSPWAVDGLVRHGLNLLVGQPGSGKSRMASALAATWLAGEEQWLGMRISDRRPVEKRELLIIGTDQSMEDWGLTLAPLGLVEELEEGQRRLHPRVTLHPLEAGTVLDSDGLALVRRWCDEHPGGMVLADSLAQLLPPGVDEDKTAAARPVHALAEAMGSCWGVLTHHTRKSAGKESSLGVGAGRGSGAIDAAVSRVLGIGLLHKREGGELVPQESDPRRELVSTKRGGPTVHLIVSSDGSGRWSNQGSAEELKREERHQRARANLTENQSAALAALEESPGEFVTTRDVMGRLGGDWEADKAEGGKASALLRKTLRRLEDLGLVDSVLTGNERTYRSRGISSPLLSASELEEDDPYESPERMADIREERIPADVREQRDTDRLWEAQHNRRTAAETLVLEERLEPEPQLLAPEVGDVVEITNGRGGWDPGYIVTRVSGEELVLASPGTGRTLTKRLSSTRPPWRRPQGVGAPAAA